MSNANEELNQALLDVVSEAMNDSSFLTDVNQMLAEKYDPYVPYVTGALAHNITVDEQGITYNQPYAEEVYESNHPHNLEHHPLASSHWDEIAFANHSDEIEFEIQERLEQWIKTKQ